MVIRFWSMFIYTCWEFLIYFINLFDRKRIYFSILRGNILASSILIKINALRYNSQKVDCTTCTNELHIYCQRK